LAIGTAELPFGTPDEIEAEVAIETESRMAECPTPVPGHRDRPAFQGPALSDPRVFFAAERTLLAWIRTGLTVMAFGFVVARFGLFLRLLAAQQMPANAQAASTSHLSNLIGIALVLLGAISMIVAATQHHRFVASLPAVDLPKAHSRTFPIALALLLGALGFLLAVYLAI
jgi:putative membrane protein